MTGGPKRLPFTVPPLVFSALKVRLFILEVHSFVSFCHDVDHSKLRLTS